MQEQEGRLRVEIATRLAKAQTAEETDDARDIRPTSPGRDAPYPVEPVRKRPDRIALIPARDDLYSG